VRERERELQTGSHSVSVVTIQLGMCVTSQAASMGSHWGVITSHTGPRLKCCMKYDHDNIRTVYTRSRRLAGP
jgi:hypothetical protein